jgi:glyoxylase-like metal-dependent hydrolase (beta-lactamase superfamily II)
LAVASRTLEVRIISIGALAAHPLRGERAPVRTGHATTTLITAGDKRILVDPGLPGPALAARLDERAGLKPGDITDVFLTSFKPDTMRGVGAFDRAAWWIHEPEREGVGVPLLHKVREAAEAGEKDLQNALGRDAAVLQKCRPAPDSLAPGVDIFPSPGVSPGCCGLLIAEARWTTLVCGDAVATVEHILAGKVLPTAVDVDRARDSFTEALEIADILVPGRDNITINPLRGPF